MRYLLPILLVLAGCTAPNAMNDQRAALRSGGDVGVTMSLDQVPEAELAGTQLIVKNTGEAILKFLDSGNVAELTRTDLQTKLNTLVPVKYQAYYSAALLVLGSQTVSVDKVGTDNVKRIKAAVIGVLRGNEAYDVKDRQPVKTP